MSTPCAKCGTPLRWIRTKAGKMMPAGEALLVGSGTEPLPKGTYIDQSGHVYFESKVPAGLIVYRIHWQDCPAAKAFRRTAPAADTKQQEEQHDGTQG